MNKRQISSKKRQVQRPVIKYTTNFHNVISSVMRHRPGWVNGREEDEKKVKGVDISKNTDNSNGT